MRTYLLALALSAAILDVGGAQVPTAPPVVIGPDGSIADASTAVTSEKRFGQCVAIANDSLLVTTPECLFTGSMIPKSVARIYSTTSGQFVRGFLNSVAARFGEGTRVGTLHGENEAFVIAGPSKEEILQFTLSGQPLELIETGMRGPVLGVTDDARLYVSIPTFEPEPGSVRGVGQQQSPSAFSVSQTYTNPKVEFNGFGTSIAASGNYTFIGAPYEDVGTGGQGTVYVFDRNTSTFLFQLNDPGTANNIYGMTLLPLPGGRLLVGPGYGGSSANRGDIWVWDVATRTIVGHIENPLPGTNYFGEAIATGNGLIAVGMRGNSELASNAGAAYLYDAYTYELLGTLRAPDGAADWGFGTSLAIGNQKLAVGAPGAFSGVGRVYLFSLPPGSRAGWMLL